MIKYSFVYASTYMCTPLWDSGLLKHYFLLLEVLVPSATGSYQTMLCLLGLPCLVHAYSSLRMSFSWLFCLVNTLSTFKRYRFHLEVAPDSPVWVSGWSQVTFHIALIALLCFLSLRPTAFVENKNLINFGLPSLTSFVPQVPHLLTRGDRKSNFLGSNGIISMLDSESGLW